MKIRVGIMGANGYMGGEALRVLLDHPNVDLAWLTSRTPGPVSDHHPNLFGCGLHTIAAEDITPCDVALLALPTEASLTASQQLLDIGTRVIDLGAAFRLRERAHWERVYNMPHTHWHLAQEAVYGITELHGNDVAEQRLVANPGCFASAAILALAPLMQHLPIDTRHIAITGISGTAGAGAEPSAVTHHPAMADNIVAYNVVDHRHSYEMEQELSLLAGAPVNVHFTPTYAPLIRGILCISHVFATAPVSRPQLLKLFRDFYQATPFVKIHDAPAEPNAAWQYRPYPQVKAVAGTNYCHLGLDVDERRQRIVVFSVLDSLGKGGAQVGVENMNLMFGLERGAGLLRFGRHPG